MRQVLAIVGSCALLLLVLRLSTIGADSATNIGVLPDPTPSSAEECASFARFWIEIAETGPEDVAAVSRCRRDTSGAWVLAEAEAELSQRDAAQARDIKDQLTEFEAALPADLRLALAELGTPVVKEFASDVDPRTEISPRYTDEFEAYLRDPAHRRLAKFVAWDVARRDAAMAAFLEGCAAYPRMNSLCAGVVDGLGRGLAPWSWDLDDDLLLAEYLAHRPPRDERPSPAVKPPSPIAD